MESLQWTAHPELDRPVVVAAFEGWNDAGDAASSAVRWLGDRWDCEQFASIDPEDFFDFTATRPEVRLEGDSRVVDWPTSDFTAGKLPDGRDVILVEGVEPHLRWRTFCDLVLDVAREFDASMMVTLGALLAEVPHSRPVNVVGTAYDPDVVHRLDLTPSTYEGPTGIVGVLHGHFRDAGIPSASLWAAVPSYVPGAPSPKATLALVDKVGDLLTTPMITTDLEIASASYERQISELVDDDDETRSYVASLEQRHDEAQASGEPELRPVDPTESAELIEQVERFLRERGD